MNKEINFLQVLVNYFRDEIKINYSVRTYHPQFIYVCQKTNLHIDIEIDEKYNIDTREPLHYIGGNDKEWNSYFLKNNWVVIRFAEKQIVDMPEDCCAFIEDTVNNIINEKHNRNEMNLKKVKRWTYEEAYLSANLQK